MVVHHVRNVPLINLANEKRNVRSTWESVRIIDYFYDL